MEERRNKKGGMIERRKKKGGRGMEERKKEDKRRDDGENEENVRDGYGRQKEEKGRDGHGSYLYLFCSLSTFPELCSVYFCFELSGTVLTGVKLKIALPHT